MKIRDEYNRNGYVVVKPDYAKGYYPYWGEEKLMGIYTSGVNEYIDFLKMSARRVDLQKILLSSKILGTLYSLGIAEPIVASQPVIHIMSPSLTIPNGYNGTSAHQDWASTQGSLDCMTVWMALSDVDCDSYPLEVIPKSHLGGFRDGTINGSVLEVGIDHGEKFTAIECEAGDVVFLSGFIVHRTGEGKRFRAAISQRFDNAGETTFIERGYPSAQKRIVDREIAWKPTARDVRRAYGVG